MSLCPQLIAILVGLFFSSCFLQGCDISKGDFLEPTVPTDSCFGSLDGLAADQGRETGQMLMMNASDCQQECLHRPDCMSISFCSYSDFSLCFFKDKIVTPDMPVVSAQLGSGGCKTYFKTETCFPDEMPAQPTPMPTRAAEKPTPSATPPPTPPPTRSPTPLATPPPTPPPTHSDPVSTHGRLTVQGNRIVNERGQPVQLKGMSLFWSQWGGKYYNKDAVSFVHSNWKATIVRAAMGIEHGGYLENPDSEREKVMKVVEAATEAGIYVIIDWHDHHAEQHTGQAKAFFEEMARRYGSYKNVMFELYNEPVHQSWSGTIKPYHEEIVPVIRRHSDNIILLGTREWCQQIDEAFRDPVAGSNLAYVFHFYAATHEEFLRARVKTALDMGFAVLASEWGTCDASGDGNLNLASAQRWADFMDEHMISSANWALNDKAESCSALRPGANPNGHWTASDITDSGTWIRCFLGGCDTPTPSVTSPGAQSGCCKWGGDCGDCGEDSSGWCHVSASNCEVCTGIFDASAAAPTCGDAPPAPAPPPTPTPVQSGGGCCKWGGVCGTCGEDGSGWCHMSASNCEFCTANHVPGVFDASVATPTCNGSPPAPSPPVPVPSPPSPPVQGGNGCCKWGNDCGDCGEDSSGWCHLSASNCEVCTGIFDAAAAAPTCSGSPSVDHGGDDFEKGSGVVSQYGRLQIKGNQLVDKNGAQVYLKGMSFFWSMWSQDYWTAENVRIMARKWKVSVLRAAVGVTDHSQDDVRMNPSLNYRLLETVVEACIEEDIYVIIDWHDHDAHLHKAEAKAFFEKYGKMYGDKEHVLWETWNEPNAASSGISWWQHCKPYHEELVPIIRKYSNNVIILGSPDWSRKVDDAANDPVRGENLAYALHFYTNYHKQDIRNVADYALQKGIALFVSEWGLWNNACTHVPCDISYLDNADEGDRWMDWCDRNKVSWVAWAIYDKEETPAITKKRLDLGDHALTPAGTWYKHRILR